MEAVCVFVTAQQSRLCEKQKFADRLWLPESGQRNKDDPPGIHR